MPQYAILLYPPAPADWAEATPEALAAYQRWAEQVEELGCKPEPTPSGEVVLAAGDIANCHAQGDEATAELVEGIDGTVLALGDEATHTERPRTSGSATSRAGASSRSALGPSPETTSTKPKGQEATSSTSGRLRATPRRATTPMTWGAGT